MAGRRDCVCPHRLLRVCLAASVTLGGSFRPVFKVADTVHNHDSIYAQLPQRPGLTVTAADYRPLPAIPSPRHRLFHPESARP